MRHLSPGWPPRPPHPPPCWHSRLLRSVSHAVEKVFFARCVRSMAPTPALHRVQDSHHPPGSRWSGSRCPTSQPRVAPCLPPPGSAAFLQAPHHPPPLTPSLGLGASPHSLSAWIPIRAVLPASTPGSSPAPAPALPDLTIVSHCTPSHLPRPALVTGRMLCFSQTLARAGPCNSQPLLRN